MGVSLFGSSYSSYNKKPISIPLFERVSDSTYSTTKNRERVRSQAGGGLSVSSINSSDKRLSDPNPNPRNYHINKLYEYTNGYVMDISYPNCTNYEGRKILVYRGYIEDHSADFMRYGIDPHFCEVPYAPIARFIPTEKGLEMAKKVAKEL